ncbi:MAG: AAA family ATPase [Bilifractor sp.]|jgi:exonuclease SbcC
MTPVKLTMQAFGSYGKKTEIDFSKLNQNLFLITGDTGAGKSTIFDAIVFALYGETSSSLNKKNGMELQSQFIGYETEPFVELTFSVRNGTEKELYTVRRIPRHMRPAKRAGAADQAVKESVSLILPDGTEYPSKEADRRIVELVGLTKDQYMQVAMIAQGEFMELLRTDSNHKKEIFRKLFHTGIYQDITNELYQRGQDKKRDMAQIRTACQQEVSHIRVPETYEHSEELSADIRQIIGSDHLSITAMEEVIEELGGLCKELKASVEETGGQAKQAGKKRDEARDAVTAGEALDQAWKEYKKSAETLEKCRQEEADIQKDERLMKQIRNALEIRSEYKVFESAAQNVRKTESDLDAQVKALPKIEQDGREASEVESKAQEARNKASVDFSRVKDMVEKSLDIFGQIEKEEQISEAEKKKTEAGEQKVRGAEKALADLALNRRKWEEQEKKLQGADTAYADLKLKSQNYSSLSAKYKAAVKENNDLIILNKNMQSSAEAYRKASAAYQAQKAEYDQKQIAFLDAQAGLLAGTLQEGKPCPVCGSVEHPHPCQMPESGENLTRELINQLAAATAEKQKESSEASVRSGEARASYESGRKHFEDDMAELKQSIADLVSDLMNSGYLEPGSIPVTEPMGLQQADEAKKMIYSCLMNKGTQLQKNYQELQNVQEKIKGAGEEKDRLQAQLDAAKDQLTQDKNALVASETKLRELRKQAAFASKQEAEQRLGRAQSELNAADESYRKAQTEAKNARQAVVRTQTLIKRLKDSLPGLREEEQKRKTEYQNLMLQKNMKESQWQELVQNYGEFQAELFQTEVDDWKQKKASAQGAAEAAKKTINGRPEPDLAVLREQQAATQKEYDEVQDRYDHLKEDYRVDQAALDALAPKMEERRQIVDSYNHIYSLYERLAGKCTGARMDIETYVQRYYLQQILYAANERFMDMSAGQYELRMVDIDQAGEGKNRGLDLMVYSYITGKEREIRTLSGGESFMAALSLALGMADQIQMGSSVNLDMLFIDEGFGSLDDHSREQAVHVLTRMANNSRLIGIISHVTELKQEIDDQLIVTKDVDGSHVQWKIS